MKALKIIGAIVISMVLFTVGVLLAGLFSVDRALSEDTVRESISQSELIGEMVDESLEESTVNMGGEYGDMVKSILKTDSMESFFTDYMVSAINTGLYGEEYHEVADDELMVAFSQGIDEVNASGEMTISTMDEEILKQAMMQEVPDLTAGLNSNISRYKATEGQITEEAVSPAEGLQTLMGTGFRVILVIISLVLLAALAALFWRSKLGFIWGAAVTSLVTLSYGILALAGAESVIGEAETSSDQFILTMATKGLGTSAILGVLVTIGLIAACLVLRYFDKKHGRRISDMDEDQQALSWKRVD